MMDSTTPNPSRQKLARDKYAIYPPPPPTVTILDYVHDGKSPSPLGDHHI